MSQDTFGRRVKRLREAAGLSQQALAQAAGLSMSAIFKLEQDIQTDPRASSITAIATALQVDPAVLLGLKPMPEAPTESVQEPEKPASSKKSPATKDTPSSSKRKK